MRHSRLIGTVALVTWLLVALPLLFRSEACLPAYLQPGQLSVILTPEVYFMPHSRLIGTIALVTWLLVALPLLLYHGPAGILGNWPWSAVYFTFGALFFLD